MWRYMTTAEALPLLVKLDWSPKWIAWLLDVPLERVAWHWEKENGYQN